MVSTEACDVSAISFPPPASISSTIPGPGPTLTFSLPESSRAPLTLVLQPDHPCCTQISDGVTHQLLYVVETEVIRQPLVKKRVVTSVRRATGEIIAQFHWKELFTSDMVSLTREIAGGLAKKDEGNGGNLITVPAHAWIKKRTLPFKE